MHNRNFKHLFFSFLITANSLLADPIEVRIGEHMADEINDSDQIINHPDNASALQFVKTASHDQFLEQSAKLEGKLDAIFARYRRSELSLAQTLEELKKPELLRGTGYIYVEAPASITITSGVPTLSNYSEWWLADAGIIGQSKSPKDTSNNRPSPRAEWNQPGIVYLSPFAAENGHTMDSIENLLLAKENLFILAEEYYHACQVLNDPEKMETWSELKYENTISNFFKNQENQRDFDRIDEREISEGDVYAKLIEALGVDAVVNRANTEERYPGRKFIGERMGLPSTDTARSR